MANLIEGLVQFCGFNGQGDLGELMVYTSRRRKLVFYPRAPPLTPASPEQKTQRDRFRQAAYMWAKQSPRAKLAWEQCARQAQLRITGYNLFTCWIINAERAWFETVIERAGINPTERKYA